MPFSAGLGMVVAKKLGNIPDLCFILECQRIYIYCYEMNYVMHFGDCLIVM